MKSVRVTIRFTEGTIHPMHRFVADHDAFGSYRLVHWDVSRDGENLLLFHVVGDHEVYEARLADTPAVAEYDVTPGADGSFSVYVHDIPDEFTEEFLGAFGGRDLIAVPPVEYREDWTIRFTIVGDPEDVRTSFDAVPDEVAIEVERVGEYGPDRPALLTTRQREVIRVARELGYYDVPRNAGVEAVAEELGCAPGTAAEHLRKAERAVIDRLNL